MRFLLLKAQSEIINSLIDVVEQGRISHAQLFHGEDSSKTFALGVAFAQYLNCTNRKRFLDDSEILADSCGECSSCVKYQTLNHPDLHLFFPNTTTKSITSRNSSKQLLHEFKEYALEKNLEIDLDSWFKHIDVGNKQGMINVRDANDIIIDLNSKSFEAKYRVMIIWAIDRLNYDAAPKLLKILEEPSDNTIFILITNNRENILPTILSRTQLVKIPRLPEKKSENYNVFISIFADWMRACFKVGTKINEVVDVIDKIIGLGREEEKEFLRFSMEVFQKSFLVNQNVLEENPLEGVEERFKNNFPNFVTENNIEHIYKELDKAILHIERNGNAKLVFLDLSIKLGLLLNKK